MVPLILSLAVTYKYNRQDWKCQHLESKYPVLTFGGPERKRICLVEYITRQIR